jgi:hypothetical protein
MFRESRADAYLGLNRTFADALPIVKDVVEGRKTPAEALAVKNTEKPEA